MSDYYTQLHGHFGDGTLWSTGLHVTSIQDEATLATTMVNAWFAAWTDTSHGLEALYPTTTSTDTVSVARLSAEMKEVTKTVLPAVNPGTTSGDSLPYRLATLVSLRSPSIQRFGRGRMFLPAMDETFVNADLLTSAAATRVSASMDELFAAIRSDGSSVFVTNKKPLKDGTPAFQKTVITSQLVSRKPAGQFRRVKRTPAIYV